MNALELAPRTHLILALILFASTSLAVEPQSPWAHVNAQGGKLTYQSLSTGDHIMDFSHAGYMGGGVALPTVPVKMKVRPTGADDTATIQAAINAVAALTPENGMRGAVLLDGARFNCASTLTISASGIVLRGNGAAKTIIAMTGTPHVCLTIEGSRSVRSEGRITKIVDAYVPSGASYFTVESSEGLAAGDTILITRPVTPEWVAFMGMDKLARDGKLQTWVSRSIVTERVIKDISGSTITFTVPLSDSLDARHQSSAEVKVSKAAITGGIEQVGVESLGISSKPQPIEITDDHNSGITLSGVTDGWVRDVAIDNAITSIKIESSTHRVTIEKLEMNHQRPTLGNAKPLDINIEGSQVFINRCSGKGDDIFYVATGGGVIGPNVVMNCEFKGNGEIQPHMRWATGMLVDNCRVPKGGIDFMNRGTYGTGHGWTIGWAVAWNCTAGKYVIQQPPGATNWAIGCRGERKTEPMPGSESNAKDAIPPSGIFDSHNKPVTPRSLYLAQLAERLGAQALKNIGY